MRRCFLGIDCGGTKCDALVADESGTAVGWGHCDVNHPASGRGPRGSGRSVDSVRYAVCQALAEVDCDELHISSLGEFVPLGFWRRVEVDRVMLHPAAEYTAAFDLVGASCGIVALSGTGSFVHGLTADGRRMHLDGLGPLIGDYGSGCHIGRLALRAAAKSKWHERHATKLHDMVLGVLEKDTTLLAGGNAIFDFLKRERDRAEIAALAPLVEQAANEGDAVAAGIICEAATAMAETLRDVVEGLGMQDEEYPLVGTGGVIAHCDGFWERFRTAALSVAPRLKPIRLSVPAVAGVVLSTLLECGVSDGDTIRDNVVRSTREIMSRPPREIEL